VSQASGEPAETIVSARLRLVPMSRPFIEALLRGQHDRAGDIMGVDMPPEWPGDLSHMLRLRLDQIRADPSELQWLARAMVLRDDGRTVVGNLGFHGKPDGKGTVEVGYTVRLQYRRQGFAEEAVRALFDWANRAHGIRRFRASVSPTNEPSLSLIRKLGFVRTGEQWDEIDGRELVFELERP
jgi:[ribosomal protein S5]-alanine N-acetyltransferase